MLNCCACHREKHNCIQQKLFCMDREKIIALVFVVLMIGSPIAYATVSAF